MHPLPSVTVLPFPRALHQGPLLADAQGAVDKSYTWPLERRKEARGMPPGGS